MARPPFDRNNTSPAKAEDLSESLIEVDLLRRDLIPVPRSLNLKQILADIREGISKSDLMKNHELAESMIRRVRKKVLGA